MARLALDARRPRIGPGALAALAAAMLATWIALESAGLRLTHPQHAAMLRAARAVESAAAAIRAAKSERGLLQPDAVDPNRTGLIGPEYTETTTSLGVLEAKRTATSPDLAAALVRVLAGLGPSRGDAVVLVLSGSFPGANVAAIAAAEALGLQPAIVHSLGASMFGATDPAFSWLEMHALVASRAIVARHDGVTVLGGGGAVARNMDEAGAAALRTSAVRLGVDILEARPATALIDAVEARIDAVIAKRRVLALVNVGGSVVGLGVCPDADRLPVGVSHRPLGCEDGTPGLIVRFARRGVPVVHVLNIKRLAAEWGLPYDPRPLPAIGNNARVYGH